MHSNSHHKLRFTHTYHKPRQRNKNISVCLCSQNVRMQTPSNKRLDNTKTKPNMESDTDKFINWNAGTEYNKIIGELKLKYINAVLIRDFDSCIELLDIDLDFAYAKMFEEYKKKNKSDELLNKTINDIRKNINEIRIFNKQKQVDSEHQNYSNYEYELKNQLQKIRHSIWKLQGQYGVLYPQNEKKKKDNPNTAIEDDLF